MKKILFLAIVLVALILPATVFAADQFIDMFIGGGTTGLTGTYDGYYPNDFVNHGHTINISNSTFDFVFGVDYYWVLNKEHTFWMGIGSTLSMAYPALNSVSPETISIDVPFEYLFSPHFSIVVKPSLLGMWMPASLNKFSSADLTGIGFSIAAGPAYYFDEHENIGVCLLAGYKYLPASCTDETGKYKTTFTGGGPFVSLYLSFELWSDDQVEE